MKKGSGLLLEVSNPVSSLLREEQPVYHTDTGAMYWGDSLELMAKMPSESVNLALTSPPYPLVFKKEYGNVDASEYVQWLLPFVRQIQRLLKDDGSFVLNLGGVWTKGA